jgi:hypothetical protein
MQQVTCEGQRVFTHYVYPENTDILKTTILHEGDIYIRLSVEYLWEKVLNVNLSTSLNNVGTGNGTGGMQRTLRV